MSIVDELTSCGFLVEMDVGRELAKVTDVEVTTLLVSGMYTRQPF